MIMWSEFQIQCLCMRKTVLLYLLVLLTIPCAAAPLGEGALDMVSINADEAREDEQPGILHFKGNFRMQTSDWHLTSEAATVYGSPDKPDRVFLKGSPARFLVNQSDRTQQGQIEGTALEVEYLRKTDRLMLSGGATLILGDEIIRSSYIEYDISTNRYKAGGTDGVLIDVPSGN